MFNRAHALQSCVTFVSDDAFQSSDTAGSDDAFQACVIFGPDNALQSCVTLGSERAQASVTLQFIQFGHCAVFLANVNLNDYYLRKSSTLILVSRVPNCINNNITIKQTPSPSVYFQV